jgi:hypothetical protein
MIVHIITKLVRDNQIGFLDGVQRRCFGSALEEIVVYGSSFVHSTDMVLKDAPKWARKVRCSESLQCFRTPVGSSSISLAIRLKAAADTIIVGGKEVKNREGQGVQKTKSC